VSGLTPEEIEVVWLGDREHSYPRFDLEAFRKVNEKRQAEGKPTVGLGEAADADLSMEDISAIGALTAVIEAVVIAPLAAKRLFDPRRAKLL